MTSKKTEALEGPETGNDFHAMLRRQIEAQERANEIAAAQLELQREQAARQNDRPDERIGEELRIADQERQSIHDYRQEGGGEVRTPLLVHHHTEYGTIPVRVIAVSTREHSEEPRHRGEANPRGEQRISTLTEWDISEAEQIIRASVHQAHAATLDDLERAGRTADLAAVRQRLEVGGGGEHGGPGVRHRVWKACTQPTLQRLVGRLLRDLLASGGAQLEQAGA